MRLSFLGRLRAAHRKRSCRHCMSHAAKPSDRRRLAAADAPLRRGRTWLEDVTDLRPWDDGRPDIAHRGEVRRAQ